MQRRTNTGGGIPTVQERYSLLKEGAEKFQVLQLGICVVSWDAAEGSSLLPVPIKANHRVSDRKSVV